MSVIVNRSTLTKEDKEDIVENLTIGIKKGKGGKYTDLVQCYFVDSEFVKLPLHYAVNVLDKTNDDINHFRKNISFLATLRPEQKVLIDQGLDRLAQQRAFSLIASTGSGKTVMGAWYACRLSCVTCILIDRQPLIEQWINTVTKFTDGDYWVVDNKPPKDIPSFIICMNLRTSKIPEYIRKEISLLIIDEAHKFCTRKNYERIISFSPIYIISMTATPGRADNGYEMMHALSGNDYVHFSSNKKIDVIRITTPFQWSRQVNPANGEIDWPLIEKELHYLPERNNMLLNLVAKNRDKKIMILSGRSDHVTMVYEALTYYGVKCDYMTGKKKSYSDSEVLVGTCSKIGTGFDESTFCPDFSGEHIDMVVIFNSYRSLIQLEQNIGRSRAEFPTIYHFVDKDGIISNHWREMKKFYEDEKSPVRATLSTIKGEMGEWIWPYDEEMEWILEDE